MSGPPAVGSGFDERWPSFAATEPRLLRTHVVGLWPGLWVP